MVKILRLTKVVTNGNGEWSISQTLTSEKPEFPDLHLFLNIKNKIVFEDAVLDLNEKGITLIEEIKNNFYVNRDFSQNTLKESVIAVYKNRSSSEMILTICAAAVFEEKIYLVSIGSGSVMLFRNNSLVRLLSGSQEGTYASGIVEVGDWYVLSDKQLLEKYDEIKIKKTLSTDDESQILNYFSGKGRKLGVPVSMALLKCIKSDGILKNTIYKPSFSYSGIGVKQKPDTWGGKLNLRIPDTLSVEETASRSRKNAIIGIILIIFLAGFSYWGVVKKKTRDARLSYISTLSEAKYKFEEAVRLVDLDKNLAQKYFRESDNLVKNLENNQIYDQEIDVLRRKIDDNRGIILGLYHIELDTYLDLRLIRENFSASQMTLSNMISFVADSSNRSIIKINMDDKRSELIAGLDKNQEINKIASYFNAVFILGRESIYKIEDGERRDLDKISGSYLLHSYAANLYLVDKNENKIYRYTANENSYTKKDWLSENNNADFTESVDIAIDGSIWILSNGPKIVVFSSGSQRQFNLGEFAQIDNVDAIYTDEETGNLYLMDVSSGSISCITKDGVYIAQYLSDKIKQAKDFVVSEKQRRIYILVPNEILFSDLKH